MRYNLSPNIQMKCLLPDVSALCITVFYWIMQNFYDSVIKYSLAECVRNRASENINNSINYASVEYIRLNSYYVVICNMLFNTFISIIFN